MNDPHRITDEIRAFLRASDQSYKDRLKDLAEEYAEACTETNRRLARCAQLIKQGLRSEAIHLAESDPNLLESLADIDFAERSAWLDLVGIYNLAAPPDLDLATAEHLNAAYGEQDPLRNLLKKHRRLALARAPLRERMTVLRELSRVDGTNPIWNEDLKAYEQVRFKQIHAELTEAARVGDDASSANLERELGEGGWSSRPPEGLITAARKVAESLKQRSARRDLPEIESELNEAFAALDVERARRARSRWLSLAEVSRLAPDNPARERAEPALIWLAGQDRREADQSLFEAVIAKLEHALDDLETPSEQLDRLYHDLARLEREIPELLTLRYRSRVAALALSTRRRSRLLLGSGLAVAVALGIGSLLIFRVLERNAAERKGASALQAALKSGRIEEVDSLLKTLSTSRPEVLRAFEVVSLMPEVEKLRANEAERVRRYTELMSQVDDAPLTGQEPAPLAEARKLAVTDAESRSIEQVARRIDRRNRDEAARIDAEVLPRLDAISGSIDTIVSSARDQSADDPGLADRLKVAWRELNEAVPKTGPLSETVLTRSRRLRERIGAAQAEVDLQTSRRKAATDLTEVVHRLPSDQDRYVRAVEKLATLYEGAAQQSDIQKVLGASERTCWESALAWSLEADRWVESATPLAPNTARERSAQCQVFLKEHPRSPDAQSVRDYMDYLQPIASRDEPEGGIRARIRRVLASPSLDPLYMIRYKKYSRDEKGSLHYYTPVQPDENGASLQFRLRVDAEGNTRFVTLYSNDVVGDRGWSPQTKLAREVKRSINMDESLISWDATMIGLARKIAGDPETDPVCKQIFLRALLELAGEGSLALRKALVPTLTQLGPVDRYRSVHWMDPDAKVDEEREEARGIIEKLPDWDKLAATTRDMNDRLRRAVGGPRPVGWLDRLSPGWLVHFTEAGLAGKELVVVVPDGDGGRWKPLGTLISGAGEVVIASPELAAEGRLVFARQKSASSRPPEMRSSSQ